MQEKCLCKYHTNYDNFLFYRQCYSLFNFFESLKTWFHLHILVHRTFVQINARVTNPSNGKVVSHCILLKSSLTWRTKVGCSPVAVFFPHQAELQEVVGEGVAEDALTVSSPSSATAEPSQAETPESPPPQVQCVLLSAGLVMDATSHQNMCQVMENWAVAGNRKEPCLLLVSKISCLFLF